MKLALDELGIPTLHTQHLYERENDEIFNMWADEIFKPSVAKGHAELGRPNLKMIAQSGYQATMDFPTALYFEQILEEFPDCKFLLTVRESSEVWYRSWLTMTTSITTPANLGGTLLTGVKRYSTYLRWLFAVINKDDTFITSTVPQMYQNKEEAIRSYEDHNRRVRELVPPENLLEYSVKQGWEPLCDFLEIKDCPTTEFPRTNSTRSLRSQTLFSTVVPIAVICFIVFYLFAGLFQRLTGRTVMRWVHYKITQVPVFLRRVLLGEKNFQAQAYANKKTS